MLALRVWKIWIPGQDNEVNLPQCIDIRIMYPNMLQSKMDAARAHHTVKMMVPRDGEPAMVDDDDLNPRSSTDLARAWEAVATLRRRGQVLQLVPLDASSVIDRACMDQIVEK